MWDVCGFCLSLFSKSFVDGNNKICPPGTIGQLILFNHCFGGHNNGRTNFKALQTISLLLTKLNGIVKLFKIIGVSVYLNIWFDISLRFIIHVDFMSTFRMCSH